MRWPVVVILALGLAAVAAPAVAQTAVVYDVLGSVLLRIDPNGPTISTYQRPYFGRGHCFAHDGGLYMGVWSPGGPASLEHLDFATKTVTTIAQGTSATHFGAPYVPCLDAEAQDGPGVWIFDGTTTVPSSIHIIEKPKACRVDVTTGTITWDNIMPDLWVPMADAYPDPYKGDRVLAVGFWLWYPSQIALHTIFGAPTEVLPQVLSTLDHPCAYDAFMHEDRRVYCWSNFVPTQKITWFPQFVGLHAMDAKNGAKQSIPLALPATNNDPWAAVWNEPWEKPGRIAYIACDADDTLYKVDLLASPPVALALTKLPPGVYIHGREVEEAQLSSWRKGPTGRIFHLNFGSALAGKTCVLAPSLAGYAATPTILPGAGLELWTQPDVFTVNAVLGHLPYPAWGVLDGTGQRAVTFDIGIRVGLDFVWTALVLEQGKVLDVSNLLLVSM